MSGFHKRKLDLFPVHTLKRVERPTTLIKDDQVKRVNERDGGFAKAAAGDYGPVLERERLRNDKEPISGALLDIGLYLRPIVDGIVAKQKAPIPDNPELLAHHIKELAYFLRSDAVGICELPPYAVFTHRYPSGEPVDLKHKNAIAILIDQDWRTSEATSGSDYISRPQSYMAYSTSGFIACVMADYIRRLGYPAKAHYGAFNYDLVVPPILLWAGLGEFSRMGECVVHPFLGPRFKAAVVTTDLPLAPDKPIDFGLQDFCSKCKKCARECPTQSISYEGKIMYNGYERWPVDVKKCTSMRVGNKHGASCGTCMTVCPWNKPYTPFHRAVGWMMRHSGVARSLAIKGDDLLGYGNADYSKKWWFQLECVDGVLHDRSKRKLKDGETPHVI
ncbi:MAG TPA: reductive dehalogenase [Syntrophorhabdaceae bacterium]|nr:reductive dehalogenase [Syntrophorhabdaceae bacterium]